MASMDDRPNLVKLTQQVKAQPFDVAVQLLWDYAELAYRFGHEDGQPDTGKTIEMLCRHSPTTRPDHIECNCGWLSVDYTIADPRTEHAKHLAGYLKGEQP